jgi:hypothetical protein
MVTVAPAVIADGEPVVRYKAGASFVAVWRINAKGQSVQYWQCMYPLCPSNLHKDNLSRHVENKHGQHFRRFQLGNEAIPLPDNWRCLLRCDPCKPHEVSSRSRNRPKRVTRPEGVAATQREEVHAQLPDAAEVPTSALNDHAHDSASMGHHLVWCLENARGCSATMAGLHVPFCCLVLLLNVHVFLTLHICSIC